MVDTDLLVVLLVLLVAVVAGSDEVLAVDDEAVVPGALSGEVVEVAAEVSDVLSVLSVLSVEAEELFSLSDEALMFSLSEESLSVDEVVLSETSDIPDEEEEVSDVG